MQTFCIENLKIFHHLPRIIYYTVEAKMSAWQFIRLTRPRSRTNFRLLRQYTLNVNVICDNRRWTALSLQSITISVTNDGSVSVRVICHMIGCEVSRVGHDVKHRDGHRYPVRLSYGIRKDQIDTSLSIAPDQHFESGKRKRFNQFSPLHSVGLDGAAPLVPRILNKSVRIMALRSLLLSYRRHCTEL